MSRSTVLITVAIAAVALASCSRVVPKLDEVVPDKRTEYRKAQPLPDLEVPPDLSTEAIRDRMAIPEGGDTATYSTYQERLADRRRQREVEQAGQAALQKLENEQLLVVSGSPGFVWPKLREYFTGNGYTLNLDDPELGVMETDWLENSAELVRDKFKVFAEPGEDPSTTVLYISHLGEQLVPRGEDLVWQARPSEPQLAVALTAELRSHIGADSATAPPRARAGAGTTVGAATPVPGARADGGENERVELVNAGAGKLYLALQQDFANAWLSTGEALGQVGVLVENADRDRGVYTVRLSEALAAAAAARQKKGMWSRLAFWKKDAGERQYRLSLTGVGEKTELAVLDENGLLDSSPAAGELIMRLHEQLAQIL